MSDKDENTVSADEINPEAHKRLLTAISRLVKTQHIKKPSRSEPVLAQDEFHLVKSTAESVKKVSDAAVSVKDLVKVLNKTSKHLAVGKEFNSIKRNRSVLRKPLEKPVAERLQRTIGYEKIKKNLSRWDAIVTRNRNADHQTFPLDYEEFYIDTTALKKPVGATIKSDLMIEMEKIEAKLRALKNQDGTDEQEDDEKKIREQITREELITRRKELAYLRIRESQKSAKARKQNKIKSKKYHKFLKREKLKEQMKEFEILQKTNPEAALERLEKLEKTRVLERASLRHKNTGTWAKNLQVRAKYDKDVRKDLAEQLALSKELTQKQKDQDEKDTDEESVENNGEDNEECDPFNPWMKVKKRNGETNEVSDFVSGYRKYWMERNKNEEEVEKYRNEKALEDVQVAKVTEENFKEEKVIKVDKNLHENLEKLEEEKRKLIKVSGENYSNGLKKAKNLDINRKKKSIKGKAPTSEWIEEECTGNPIELNNSSCSDEESNFKEKDIDDIFDEAEELVQKKVALKMKKLKDALNISRTPNNSKVKQNVDNNVNYKDLSFKSQAVRPEFDEELIETTRKEQEKESNDSQKIPHISNLVQPDISDKHTEEIDPNKFANIKSKVLRTSLPDMVNSGEFFDDSDEENIEGSHQMTIAEAFQDDDIVADFEKEREDERKKNSAEEVDLTLPGWGSWAGCGISKDKQKKRLVLKFPKEERRRDDNKGNVYINEDENKKLKEHLVSDLPFPFTCVKDYEASIRAPIGRTFIPETAFKVLTRPAVVTKMGHIINPMDESILVKRPKRPRSVVDARIEMLNKKDKK